MWTKAPFMTSHTLMTSRPATNFNLPSQPPTLPSWFTRVHAKTYENLAFRAGAALAVLDQCLNDQRNCVPVRLLANRLALTAATATAKLEGRLSREEDIRDAFHLTPPGAARGPDGDLLSFWREGARIHPNETELLVELVGHDLAAEAKAWLGVGTQSARSHGPLAGCAAVLRAVVEVDDRLERVACLLSDVVLARALNWNASLPVSAMRLSKSTLRNLASGEEEGRLAAQASILESIEATVRISHRLSERAQLLRLVAPKLRAKGAGAAADLFLIEDAVAPSSMLSPYIRGTTIPMTDRAARRLCHRLVELGVVQELTGRSTFRLYGIAP